MAESQHSKDSSSGDSPQNVGAAETVERVSIVSTCTSGCDAATLPDPTLGRLAVSMFGAIEDYLQSELQMTLDDYAVLAEMNRLTQEKYTAMSSLGEQVHSSLAELDAKYAALAPCLSKLDSVEESLGHLETLTARLDAYSRQLESRVKSLL